MTGEGSSSELTCLLAALRSWQVVGLMGSIPEDLCQPESALSSLLCGPLHVSADLIEAIEGESQQGEFAGKMEVTMVCNITMMATFTTFAIFYCLEASHRPCSNPRGGDYTGCG